MTDGFDLRDRHWIPVRINDRSERVGLRELFNRADEIQDVEVPVPPAASGLVRILAAMTARITGLDGKAHSGGHADKDRNWFVRRSKILAQGRFDAEAVRAYLDDTVPEGHLDLFGPRPFLQDPRLRAECVDAKGGPNPSGVNKLVLGRPTGVNGAVLFGHFTDASPVPIPAAEAAWHLIAQLYYGPSGQCTPRRITSVRTGSGDAGPLRKTVSFHAWATDLFTTLVLAVPPPVKYTAAADDRCPWEEVALPDPLAPPADCTWPGRVLTGRAKHAVLLEPTSDFTQVKDAYVTWSTHAEASGAADPYVILDLPKTGDAAPYARLADNRRALWRDLDSLLLKGADHQSQMPAALEDLPRTLRSQLRVRAYGFDQDGQQRDSSWYEATTPAVLHWQHDVDGEMALRVAHCHQAAESIGDRLEYAARLAWKLTCDPQEDPTAKVKLDRKKPGPWSGPALEQYWSRAERQFWQLLTPPRLNTAPHRPFLDVALAALDDAMGKARTEVRGARARSRARAALFAALPRPSAAAAS